MLYFKGKEVMVMRIFDYFELKNKQWDSEILGYISQIYAEKGKQELYLKQKPSELKDLVEIAKIQSTEASNEIEGIRTTSTRLKQIMTEKSAPKNRNESEIAGYRDALKVIHESYDVIPITPNFILQLHGILLGYLNSGMGGKYKNIQNYISATDGNGMSYTLFTPLSPFETPSAMASLCEQYNLALSEGIADPLILIPIFVHDFLCIHPFLDGNGRMSRLLTTLLLCRSGFYIGKYVSLESKIAEHKDLYYDSLAASQSGWHENSDDPLPFIKYLLGTIVSSYRDFERRMEINDGISVKARVRKAVDTAVVRFTKREICELCPTVSISSVELVLRELVKEGCIERCGAGRSVFYVKTYSR